MAKSIGWMLLALFGFIVLMAIIGSLVPSEPSAPPIPLLHGNILYHDSVVGIVNGEKVALRNCVLTLSGHGTYVLKGVDVAAGDVKFMDAREFVNDDRERFDPYRYVPESIDVECDTQDGKRAGIKKF